MPAQIVAGIDVGKHWLDGAVLPSGEHRRLANTEQGWHDTVTWLTGEGVALTVLEASGGYEHGIVHALAEAKLPVSVTNPLLVRRFVQSQGVRAKTDRIDAAMLARYAQQVQPVPTVFADDRQRTVAVLANRRRQLIQMRTAEKNRLEHDDAVIREDLLGHIAYLTARVRDIERQLAELLQQDEVAQTRVAQLLTVPGFGIVTVSRLEADLPELGTVPAKVVNALVGVAPFAQDSGQHRGRRHIAGGRKWVRQTLFESVLTTIRCDPTFAAYYTSLREAGKPHKVAMVACIRRLLGIVTAMLRDGLTWKETDIGKGHYLPSTT